MPHKLNWHYATRIPVLGQARACNLQPFFTGVAVLLCYWLMLLWMCRRKLFLAAC